MENSEVFQKIKAHADASSKLEQERLALPVSSALQRGYENQLDKTVKDLQDQLKQHEAALQKLRGSNSTSSRFEPSPDPTERLTQVRTIKSAYESLTKSDPHLPSSDSALPALLALRDTHQDVTATKAAIRIQNEKLAKASERFEKEKADLQDARLMTEALKARIERLKKETVESERKSSKQIADDMIREQQKLGKDMEKDIKKLMKALNQFIDNDLAAMLAAEGLGGPITGDELNIDNETLAAGYTHQGRPKKLSRTRSSNADGKQVEDAEHGGQRLREAAALEMRELLEALLKGASDGNAPSTYINLERDSAASRFLVRAKVAQFHPRDAQRIRLLDFGRDIDN